MFGFYALGPDAEHAERRFGFSSSKSDGRFELGSRTQEDDYFVSFRIVELCRSMVFFW